MFKESKSIMAMVKLKKSIVIWMLLISIIFSAQASACEVTGPNRLEIVLRPGSGFNMTLLNECCEQNSCSISDSKIIYQSHYDPRVGVIISKSEIRNPERSNIQILGTWSTNLRDTTGEEKIRYERRVDVTNLSNQEIIELSSLELSHLKIGGYLSEEAINALRSGSHQIIINFTCDLGYGEHLSVSGEEMYTTLSTYKKVIRPASVTEVYLIGLVVPEKGTKFNSLRVRMDLKDLSTSQILDLIQNAPGKWDIHDEGGNACAIGMNCLKYGYCNISTKCSLSSDEKIIDAKNKNRTEVSFITAAPLYTTEDEAINEIKEFLGNYGLELPTDMRVGYAPTYVVSLDEFNWSAAVSLELKTLLSGGVLYGIQDEDINAIGGAARPRTFIYFKPSGCGSSYPYDRINNSNESGWLVGAGNCGIEEYENDCPRIRCYECGPVSSTLDIPNLPLNLQPTPTEEEPKTVILRYIFGGIIVVILILYFVYEKIKK